MALVARSTIDDDTPPGPKPAPLATMVEWLKVLYEEQGGLVNLRAFGVRRVQAGKSPNESQVYAPDEQGLTQLARRARELTTRCPAVYATLNPVMSTVGVGSARAELITSRRWLFVDFDAAPGRGERSSSDEEKQLAKVVAGRVVRWLKEEHGWPDPVRADSGNGYHALYRVELPNDQAAYDLVRDVLRALHHRFGDEQTCKIDPVCCNADRLTKVYGTLARTGEPTALHPHRPSAILSVPDDLVVVERGKLEAVASLAPVELKVVPAPDHAANGHARKKGLIARAGGDAEETYVLQGLDREIDELARAHKGDRNNQLFRTAAAVFELVNTGRADEASAVARLRQTALAIGLTDAEVDASIASARKKVGGRVRDLSHVGNGAARTPVVLDPETGIAEKLDDPHRLARSFLAANYRHEHGPLLRWWNEEWWTWSNRRWAERSQKEVHGDLAKWCKAEFDRHAGEFGGSPKGISTKLVANAALALQSLTQISLHETPEQPAWLDGIEGPDPSEILNTKSGIIHLPTLMVNGPEATGAVCPPTPRLFTCNALDYPFDPSPPEPTAWLAFLDSIWGDDPESKRALQQWFGCLLTSDTSQQKILFITGPKRSGKGTIARVIEGLVGRANTAAPKLAALAGEFGCQQLIGKSVALIPEVRIQGRLDSQQIVEALLSISGEDPQSINRKHTTFWRGTLRTRFVILGTEVPRLNDYSGALPNRLIVLKLTRSFLGGEDMGLSARLLAELPSILAWAIHGWLDLRQHGRFIQPQSGRSELEQIERLTNPGGAFLADCCEIGPDKEIPTHELYEAWKEWCKENGRDHPGDIQGFGRTLKSSVSTIETKQVREGRFRLRKFVGVALLDKSDRVTGSGREWA